jgi:uncharacterized ferredoxin-like protein
MIKNAELNALRRVAEDMILAARTAPKARGLDNLVLAILEPAEIQQLADEMKRIGTEHDAHVFIRDAENIRACPIAVLLGTRIKTLDLKVCGFCGFTDCLANQKAGAICSINAGDLGIAIGSAVSVAAAAHADNRVMYSMGRAAVEMKLLGPDVRIAYGIPLSATGKNPFFDRK